MCHKADLPFLSIWLMQDEACSIPASDKCVHSYMHVDFHVQAHTHTHAYMCIGIAATLCMHMCLMWICIFAHTCKLMLTSLLRIYITFHILYIYMPHSIHANIYTHIWVSIHVHCHTRHTSTHEHIYVCTCTEIHAYQKCAHYIAHRQCLYMYVFTFVHVYVYRHAYF